MALIYSDNVTALNAVTVDTTSAAYDFSLRQQLTCQFICANHTSGNGVFSIDASNDGSNWVTGIACQDMTATGSTTWVLSVTLSTNTTKAVKVPTGFRYYRAVVDMTTDGSYTAVFEAS